MVEIAHGTAFTPARRRLYMRELTRVAAWGLVALGALTLAAYAASFEVGEDRLILAVANLRGVPPPERLTRATADAPTRQLAQTVHELSKDREQLIARLDSLERNVSDVTSSIARSAIPPPVAPPSPPVISAPEATLMPPAPAAPKQTLSEEPATAKPEFGIDLGRANTVEGLRQLWTTMKNRHGGTLEGLRPIVTVREIARPGGVEIRLVAGPLPNAAAAARLCATLAGVTCHPTVFDGQRLALR